MLYLSYRVLLFCAVRAVGQVFLKKYDWTRGAKLPVTA